MAFIEDSEIISDGALNRPKQLGDALDRVYVALTKILKAAKESESAIVSSKSTAKVSSETQKLTKAQKDLTKEQEKAAKIAQTLWLSQNEVANAQNRAAQSGKQLGTVTTELDKKMASAANSANAYGKAQKTSNEQSAKATQVYKAESGSLNELIQKRTQLQAATAAQRKDQQEDLRLTKEGVISRAELNKRITESNAIIARNGIGIQNLNREIKNNLLTNTQLGGEYQKLTIKMEAARNKYKDLAASGTATNKVLTDQQKVFQDLYNKVTTVDNAVGQFQRNVGNYPRQFGVATESVRSFIGAFGLVSGIAIFAKLIKEVVGYNAQFEKQNSRLQGVLGTTKKGIEDLRKQQMELGKSTAFMSTEYAELQIELAKLGFLAPEIEKITESTANAAVALGSDLAGQAELTGSTLRAFGLSASDATMVNDQLAKSTAATALGFEKLSTGLPYVAAAANQLGFSLSDTLALMGELSNQGLAASTIGTSLRSIFLKLADSSSALSKKFKEPVRDLPALLAGLRQLTAEGTDLGEALELTDVRSVNAFAALIKGADNVEALSKTIQDANGFAKQLSATVNDNLLGDFALLQNAIRGISEEVKTGWLRELVRGMTSLVNIFTGNKAGIISTELDTLAKTIGGQNGLFGSQKYIQTQIDLLKKLREETGKPLDEAGTVAILTERYKLTNDQALTLLNTIKEINKSLSPDEKLIASFEEYAKGFKTIEEAAISFKKRINDQQFELRKNLKDLLFENQKYDNRDKEIKDTNDLIKSNERLLKLIAEYQKVNGTKSGSPSSSTSVDEAGLKRLKEAQLDLDKFRLEQQAKVQQEIISNDKNFIDDRITASFRLETIRGKIAEIEREKELLNETLNAKQITLVNEQKEAAITDARRKGTDERDKLNEDEAKERLKIGLKEVQAEEDLAKSLSEKLLLEIEKRSAQEVEAIQQAVLSGRITRSQGDKEILRAQQKAAQELIAAEISSLQERLNTERTVYYEERKKLVNESFLDEAEKALKLQEIEAESQEERIAIEKKIFDLRKQFSDNAYQFQFNAFENEIELLNKVEMAWQAYGSAVLDIIGNIQAKRIADLQAESDANAAKLDRDLELAGDNEKAKKKLRDQAAKDEEKLEVQRRRAQREAAIADKAFKLVGAAINGASAVLVQLGGGDPYSAIPRALAAGALAALQIAAIATQPIPKYAEGTDNHPGGAAIIGEAGVELVSEPGKEPYLTDGATLKNLPAHTKVTSNQDLNKLALQSLFRSSSSDKKGTGSDIGFLGDKIDGLNSTIKNKKELHINFSKQGVEALFVKGASRQKFMSDFYL